jgi:hypothetical protein
MAVAQVNAAVIDFTKFVGTNNLMLVGEQVRVALMYDRVKTVKYANDCEMGKVTSEAIVLMPPETYALFYTLQSRPFVQHIQEVLDCRVNDVAPDNRGAGMHLTLPGGWLSPHLDYSLHPSGKERRFNAIVFLNEEWRDEWGGELVFYHPDCVTPLLVVKPELGRCVVWESSDLAYHGVMKVNGPAPRVTAAMYYLAPPRNGLTRTRALFAPNRERR